MATVMWTTTPQMVENGAQFTQYAVRIYQDGPVPTPIAGQMVPFGTTSAEFLLDPGTYVAHVNLASADGETIGLGAQSDPFVVPVPAVSLDVPTMVSVSVA